MVKRKDKHPSTQPANEKKNKKSIINISGNKDEGLEIVGFKLTTLGDRSIIQIAHELVAWASETSDALKTSEFFSVRGISMNTVRLWRKRLPFFEQLYSIALTTIGDRREKLGLKKIFDSSIVMRTMPIYDRDYRDSLEWLESIKKDNTVSQQPIVIIERYPSCDTVPPHKEQDHE